MKFGQTRKGYNIPAMTAPVRTYLPNKYKVFNIYGNVAEMVAEPKVAMGGSFLHYYDDIVPTNATLTYDGPQSWLGFRSVCEIY
jgi:formylglycine-generating enzyme required for sulfatase activity